MFSTQYGTYFSFQIRFQMFSAICFNLDQSKILSSGNALCVSNPRLYSSNIYDTEIEAIFENIVGKGDKVVTQHNFFSLNPYPKEKL